MLLNLNPETVTAIGVLMPTLASIATGLRFYGRRRLRVPLKEDDWTTLVSVFLVWGLGITHIAGAALGALGAHSKPAPPGAPRGNTILRGPEDHIAEQIVLGYSIVEKLAFGVIKISVLLAYRRIFRGKAFNIVSLCMIVICTLLALAFLITSALQCHVRNWSLKYVAWSHRRHCIQAATSWSGYAISDVITDLIILLIPLPLIWQLQLTTSKKVSVLMVFLLGSFSTAVGVVRMAVILYFTYGTSHGYRDLLDTISTALHWSLVEASVAIIASCMPSIRPLIHRSSGSYGKSGPSSTSQQISKFRASHLAARPVVDDVEDVEDFQRLAPRAGRPGGYDRINLRPLR